MSQQKEEFIRSEVAVDVMRYISEKEDGSYSTEIAENLGKSQSSISRILSSLKKKGAVKKGKRTKAQYYEIDLEGLVQYWFSKIDSHLKESEDTEGFFYDVSEEFRKNEEEIKQFTSKYFDVVLPKSSGMTFYELIFTSYAVSLSFINAAYRDSDSWEFPNYLHATNRALLHFIDLRSFHPELAALIRTSE